MCVYTHNYIHIYIYIYVYINVSENQVSDEGASALAEALTSPRPLRSIFLHGNLLQSDGVRALAQGLVTNSSLVSLTLTAADAPIYIQHLRTSPQVTGFSSTEY